MGYDAFMADVGEEDMYWYFDNSKFVIQGVDRFDETQEFHLGLVVKQAGIIRIELEVIENSDDDMLLYIKDESTGETYNINNNSFDLFLDPGTYNERFALVFQNNNALSSTDDFDEILSNVLVYYDTKSSELKIVNKNGIYISDINLFNILGQNVNEYKLKSSKAESIKLALKTGVYIIDINTENGQLSKKIIVE